MKTKRVYAHRNVFCKTSEDVDTVLNDEIYKLNKPEDIVSLQVIPLIDPHRTQGFVVPYAWMISYVYTWLESE